MNLRPFLASCLLAATLARTAAESGGMELSAVFVAGQDGYHTYRIPAIVVTTNGTVLAFCEGRTDGRSDTGNVDLVMKRSTDGGRNWSAQRVVWSDAENTCGNPAPVVDRATGVIWLLMTWNLGKDHEREIHAGTSQDSRRVYITHSADEGTTWAAPTELTSGIKPADWRWYATGPVNGIQLERGNHAGRLVIPCNHSVVTGGLRAVSRAHIIYSDDHGATWQLGGVDDERTNESTVVELSDGRLLHNMRSYREKKLRAIATSSDGGLSWSGVKDDPSLIEPVCQASMLRYSWPERGGKGRVLFANPASDKREKLTVKVSYDEGQTWVAGKLIHAGPSAYSCLTVLPDRTIACLFERGAKSPYETITLARFSLGWLENVTATP